MNELFSVEETNLMCIFDTSSRSALLTGLADNLSGIYDPDMREVFESTITKLENLTDEEFLEIGLYIADDYIAEEA